MVGSSLPGAHARLRDAYVNTVGLQIPLSLVLRGAFRVPLDAPNQAVKMEKAMAECHRAAKKLFENWDRPLGDPHNADEARAAFLALLNALFNLDQRKYSSEDIRRRHRRWCEIADHYGFWQLRYLLEDAVLHNLDPQRYRIARSLLLKHTKRTQDLSSSVMQLLDYYLSQSSVEGATVSFRAKNVAGVCEKIERKGKSLNHITDFFGFRVVVRSVKDCYKALAVIHRLWPPYREHFRDYIRTPKENGYQSIHTIVHCLDGHRVEFQIRTEEMDWIAKYGTASHALYKSGSRAFAPRLTRPA